MDAEHAVGYAAMCLISVIQVPQLAHTYRTKSVSDLSWGTIFNNGAVGALSAAYGYLIHKPPLYIANSISLACTLVLARMKQAYGRGGGHPPPPARAPPPRRGPRPRLFWATPHGGGGAATPAGYRRTFAGDVGG